MRTWAQRTTNGSGKTTVQSTPVDLVQHRAAILVGMLFKITIHCATNNGTHNKRRRAWTYEYLSAAQPKPDAIESHTDFGANRSYQR